MDHDEASGDRELRFRFSLKPGSPLAVLAQTVVALSPALGRIMRTLPMFNDQSQAYMDMQRTYEDLSFLRGHVSTQLVEALGRSKDANARFRFLTAHGNERLLGVMLEKDSLTVEVVWRQSDNRQLDWKALTDEDQEKIDFDALLSDPPARASGDREEGDSD